jgi:hypothetical protein
MNFMRLSGGGRGGGGGGMGSLPASGRTSLAETGNSLEVKGCWEGAWSC